MLTAMAAPAAQALTVTAFVVKQTCINGDVVEVTLSATCSRTGQRSIAGISLMMAPLIQCQL